MRNVKLDELSADFKRAEQELERLTARHADTKQKLLKAGMDVSAIESKIEAFARSVDADPGAAAHLISDQERAQRIALLLEQAESFLETEVAKAKAGIASIEVDIAKAHAAQQNELLDKRVIEFLKANAATFQALVQTASLGTFFGNVAEGKPVTNARDESHRHVEELFRYIFPPAVSALWADDQPFRSRCVPDAKQATVVRSSLLTDAERHTIRTRGYAALLPQNEPDEPAFDFQFAIQSRREAVQAAEHHRSRAETYRERAAQNPNDADLARYAEEHDEQAARYQGIADTWDRKIAGQQEAA